jgi:hypothetical protein
VPDNDFFEKLYEDILIARGATGIEKPSKEDMKRVSNMRDLETAVAGNKAAADTWTVYQNKKDVFAKSIYSEIQAAYDDMKKRFSETLNSILEKHKVDPDKREEFFGALSSVFVNEEAFDKAVDIFKLAPLKNEE